MKANNKRLLYMKLFFTIILLFPFLSISASTYTLYIASTKNKNIAKKYIEEVNDLLKIENLVVRTHKKENYSLIVNQIKDIQSAKDLQNKLKKTTYKDSFVKKDLKDLKYNILFYTKSTIENKTIVKEAKEDEKEYILDVESSNEYITASTMYNIGNYKRSYELFNKLFYKHNYNLNINYFLAQSAIKLGMYDEASIAFERVLIQDPKFNKARYDYARLLTKLKLKKEAKKEFNILLKENITEEIKKDVKKYLKYLNKERKLTYNSATLILGAGHNSNVNNGLLSTQYTLPGLGDISVRGEEPISDNFHNEILSLDFNNILKSNTAIKIKNSLLAYNKSYLNEKDENISVFTYKPSVSYIYNKYLYGLESNISRVLKKENNDINILSLSPFISNKKFKASLDYQKLLYTNSENKNKNFEKYSFGFLYNLQKNINLFLNLEKITRIKKERIDIDRASKELGIAYNYRFNNKNMYT